MYDKLKKSGGGGSKLAQPSKAEERKKQMSRKEKKQVAKITIFLTSVFVIFLSVTYAFINITLAGTKRHIINAGTLEVELEEENEITIENAFPMYDETGMIQDAFVFHVRNKDELRINYTLRLEDITQSAEKLSTADVKYGLKKGDEVTIDLLSNLENGVIEEGSLGKKERDGKPGRYRTYG